MNNNTEFTGIAEQTVEEETLLPEEQAQFDDIVANATMKKNTDYTKQNAVLMVRGQRPEFLYNPQTDSYDRYPGGIEGTQERGIATEFSDLEKLAAEEFIRDYRQRHGGRFVTYDELVFVTTASKIKAEYNRTLYTFIDAFNDSPFTRKDAKKKTPSSLSAEAGWMLIEATGDVRILHRKEGTGEVLGFYHHYGKHAGTWTLDERGKGSDGKLTDAKSIVKVCSQFGIKEKGAPALIYANLQNIGAGEDGTTTEDDIEIGVHAKLIPCGNGVVDITNVKTTFTNPEKTEWAATGFEFEPYLNDDGTENESYTRKYKNVGFVYKLATDWNPNATSITLTAPDGYSWSVDKGLAEMTEEGEGKNAAIRALWELANACIRGTGLNQNPILTDGTRLGNGGGGKSTFLRLIAAVIDLITNKLAVFRNIDVLCDKQFGLQGLENLVLAIFGNESKSNDKAGDAGISGTDRWKALMRHDPLTIDRKCLPMVDVKILAPFVQAVNGGLKLQTNDAASWRGVFAIMFPKRFTTELDKDGNKIDRRYISDDWVLRKEVREYVLYKALSLGAITDYNPEAIARGEKNLSEVRTERNTVYEYMNEWGSTVLGDRHILDFVFDHYRLWCQQTNHRGGGVPSGEFARRVGEWIDTCHPGWKLIENNTKGVKFKKKLPAERYLAEIKLNMNKGRRDIGQFVGVISEDGFGHYKSEWTQGKKFTGAYLDRDGAVVQELTATSPEEETQYYGEWLAHWFFEHANDFYYNHLNPNDRPTKEDWIKAGKPRVKYSDYFVAGANMLLDSVVPTTGAQSEEEQEIA